MSFIRKRHGIMVPIVLIIISICFALGIVVYNRSKYERSLVVRFRFSSVADKLAQTAAIEAANWFNYKIFNLKELDQNNKADNFILAILKEKSLNGLISYLTPSELKSFSLIEELGGKLESVELKYENFIQYFTDSKTPSDYSKSSLLAADPFERFGVITFNARVKYMDITRSYYCVHELKISNTLIPVLSKFTLFAKDKDDGCENQIKMAQPSGENDIGGQGILDEACSPLRVPIILVHHPNDMKNVYGYYKNYGELFEYLPCDKSVTSSNQNYYRPMIHNRGWVFLGNENKDAYYQLNISPGNANPDIIMPYPSNLNYKFYGNGFLFMASDLCSLIFKTLKGNHPYRFSFVDAKRPDEFCDFITKIANSGIYWILKSEDAKPIIGNYTANNPEFTTDSSLLQLYGDVQPLSFSTDPAKPSKYLDRRSPTIIFGKVIRAFMQVGNLAQNCNHSLQDCDKEHYDANMLQNGMHKLPYINPPVHPKTTFLPNFNIDNNGIMGKNPAFDFDNREWGGYRVVDDSNIYTVNNSSNSSSENKQGKENNSENAWVNSNNKPLASSENSPPADGKSKEYVKAKYDLDNIFVLSDSNHFKTYKYFMTQLITEVYNRSYDWVTANSTPKDGNKSPGSKYSLKQNDIKILSSYPDSQLDQLFFYNIEKNFGNVFYAYNIKISQYIENQSNFEECGNIYKDGMFKGNLSSLTLSSKKYVNPLLSDDKINSEEYDLRQKANYIFNDYGKFKKYMIFTEGKINTIKEGGVFYIDSEKPVDFSEENSVEKLIFHENTLIICRSDIKIPDIIKSSFASENQSTLTIVSTDGDIWLGGNNIHASINSLKGSVKKEKDYFQIFGNLTMNKLLFNLSTPGNLFKVSALPPSAEKEVTGKTGIKGFERINIVYDPCIDICNYKNYLLHYNIFLSTKPTYWRLSSE